MHPVPFPALRAHHADHPHLLFLVVYIRPLLLYLHLLWLVLCFDFISRSKPSFKMMFSTQLGLIFSTAAQPLTPLPLSSILIINSLVLLFCLLFYRHSPLKLQGARLTKQILLTCRLHSIPDYAQAITWAACLTTQKYRQ